ncbi:MAG: hypothetical protein ACSLFP_10645 [Acidimicrobiales bacterium]
MRTIPVVLVAVALGLAGCQDSGPGDDGDQAAFCQRLDRLTANDPFQAFGDVATGDQIEAAFAALTARADELVEVAPPEPRGAARDYAEAADELSELLDRAGYDPVEVDSRAYRDAQQTYVEAADRLLRYLDAEC